jgi:hypothetical protein
LFAKAGLLPRGHPARCAAQGGGGIRWRNSSAFGGHLHQVLRAVVEEEASGLQWWSVSNVFSTLLGLTNVIGGFVLTLVILF